MKVKVYLKDDRAFDYGETAILDDKEAGRVVLSLGAVLGGRITKPNYEYADAQHIAYSWSDIEKIEVAQ